MLSNNFIYELLKYEIFLYISFVDFCEMKNLGYNHIEEEQLLLTYNEFMILKKMHIEHINGKIYIVSLNGNFITTQTIIMSNNFTLLRYLIDNIYINDFCINILIDLEYDVNIIKYILDSDRSYINVGNINFYNMFEILNTNLYELIYYIVRNGYFNIKYEHIKYAKKKCNKKVVDMLSYFIFE